MIHIAPSTGTHRANKIYQYTLHTTCLPHLILHMAGLRIRFSWWAKLPAVESIVLSEGQSSTITLVPREHPEDGAENEAVPAAADMPEEDHQSTFFRHREWYGFRTLERMTWGIICMFTVTTLVLIVLFAFFGFLWHKQVLAHDRHQGLDKPNSRSVVVHPSRGS
jgi:hypothetical protein